MERVVIWVAWDGEFGYHGTMPTILIEELGMALNSSSATLAEGKTIAKVAAEQDVTLDDSVATLVIQRADSGSWRTRMATLTYSRLLTKKHWSPSPKRGRCT